ncbi:MAG: AraC family transcriptional regulator [Cyanobacteria bacterium J06600_6]
MSSEAFPTDLNGDYIEHTHLLTSEKAEWENLSLIYEFEPAGEMPESVMSSHAVVLCLGNFQGSFYLDGQWHQEQYCQGDIALVGAGELFPRFRTDREVPLLELFLDPYSLVQALGKLDRQQIRLRSQLRIQDPLIQQMALALKTELEVSSTDSKEYADSMATALGVHLLQRYGDKQPRVKEYQGGLTPSQLRTIVEYIQAHLDCDLSLNTLASLIHISPHYFASLFKQSTGISPHKYIIQCRLERAKQLLRQDLAISFICQSVGFKNQSHFTKVFRQHFKITPKAYRDLS